MSFVLPPMSVLPLQLYPGRPNHGTSVGVAVSPKIPDWRERPAVGAHFGSHTQRPDAAVLIVAAHVLLMWGLARYDNAVRFIPRTAGERVRTDLGCPLFLNEPADCSGGELMVEDTFGAQSVKLPAGDMVLYPGTSVHRVEPVARGACIASFVWVEAWCAATSSAACCSTWTPT